MALTNAQRIANYRVQNDTNPLDAARLTPAQRRRVTKHAHRDLRTHKLNRVSRLRKAFDRRERRRLRAEGAVLMHVIRTGRAKPFLRALQRRR